MSAEARALVTAFDNPVEVVDMINQLDRDHLEMAAFALVSMTCAIMRDAATARAVDPAEYRRQLFAHMALRGAEAVASPAPVRPPPAARPHSPAVVAPLPPVTVLLLRGWPRVNFGWGPTRSEGV